MPILFGLIILGKLVCPNKEEDPPKASCFNYLASIVTSSKDRLKGPILFGLVTLGKLVSLNKEEEEKIPLALILYQA